MSSYLTQGMRLLFLAAALAILGAFFLPWLKLDGPAGAYSGAELIALAVSPQWQYLTSVNQLQAAVLVGAPAAMLLFAIVAISKYVRKRRTPLAILLVLAAGFGLVFGTAELVDRRLTPSTGFLLAMLLAAVLLFHQGLISVHTELWERQKFPAVYRALGVITGAGIRPWRTAPSNPGR